MHKTPRGSAGTCARSSSMGDAPLTGLLATLPLPTLAIDTAQRIVALNPPAGRLFGVAVVNRHFTTVLRQPVLVRAIEACLKDDTARQAPYLKRTAGRDGTYDVHVQRIGADRPVVLSFQDMTQHTDAGQMRRDFVANVSHELRTPLTSLMGFIETLRGAARDDASARDRFLGIMEAEAGRMNRLVGDLLSLSRVEADERVRPTDALNLTDVLQTTLRNISPLADQAHVEIMADVPSQPLRVLGDGDQLQQVFANLIENAIKYGGDHQRVQICASTETYDRTLRAPAVQIDITDSGPGIAPEHLPRLTERFYRADSHRSRAMGGTGLGLAIVKHILNRHRGRLKITSEVGKGACFTVTLPLDMGEDS